MIRFEIDDLHILNWPSISINGILNAIPSTITNITISSVVGNDRNMTTLNFTRFIFLKQINIGTNALNGMNYFKATNLSQLNSMNVGEGSLTSIQT